MLYPLLPLGPSLLPSPTQSRQRSPCRRPRRDLQMDPDPLRLLETAHPLRSPTLRPSPPNSRFRLRPSYRLTRPKTVNKRVNKIEKFVDGPTQMSRRRYRARFQGRLQLYSPLTHTDQSPKAIINPKREPPKPAQPFPFLCVIRVICG